MNAAKTSRAQPFGIGTRTEIRLDEQHLLTLSVRAGDLLRSAGGTVWATVDGEANDILLQPGDVHLVPCDRELRVSAFGLARLEVYGHGPLRWRLPRQGFGAVLQAWIRQLLSLHRAPAMAAGRALGRPA